LLQVVVVVEEVVHLPYVVGQLTVIMVEQGVPLLEPLVEEEPNLQEGMVVRHGQELLPEVHQVL
jgi:hypothetical protein